MRFTHSVFKTQYTETVYFQCKYPQCIVHLFPTKIFEFPYHTFNPGLPYSPSHFTSADQSEIKLKTSITDWLWACGWNSKTENITSGTLQMASLQQLSSELDPICWNAPFHTPFYRIQRHNSENHAAATGNTQSLPRESTSFVSKHFENFRKLSNFVPPLTEEHQLPAKFDICSHTHVRVHFS